MTFKNFTPHALNVADLNGKVVTLPSSGVARVATIDAVTTMGDFNLTTSTFGDVTGLPDPQDDVIYVVSRLVLNALNDSRADVVAPGPLMRNDAGDVIGCQGFGL